MVAPIDQNPSSYYGTLFNPIKEALENEFTKINNVGCPDDVQDANDRKRVALGFLKIGETKRAVEVANTIRMVSGCIGELPQKGDTFSDIVDFLIKDNKLDKAFEIANSLEGGFYEDDVLKSVAFTLLSHRFKDEAVQIINKRKYSKILKPVALKFDYYGFKEEARIFANQIKDERVKNETLDRIENPEKYNNEDQMYKDVAENMGCTQQ